MTAAIVVVSALGWEGLVGALLPRLQVQHHDGSTMARPMARLGAGSVV
jgi:hypothetical protein